MKRYILPPSLKESFDQDPVLKQIREQGESQKMPEISFYQAALLAMIEQRNHFMIETFRYLQQYGQLPPLEETNGKEPVTETEGETKEEYPEHPEYPTLRVVTDPNDKVKFRKLYE